MQRKQKIMNKRFIQIVIASCLLIAISVAVYYRDRFDIDLIEQWINQAGWWAPLIFIGLIVLGLTLAYAPSSAFERRS